MLIVSICEQFHWTYDEYMRQPNWFVTLIREKLVMDRKERDLQAKKQSHGRR